MNGVLVVDKPEGPTSFDVVRRVRHALRLKKAGHTGTLDPAATGVLPICLEDATRVAGYITEGDKAYDAVIRLGQTTDTQDATGLVLEERPVPALTAPLLEAALARFRGTFDQIPPMYSAVKVNGRRLYELARKGEEIERKARTVTVHELRLRDFSARELTISVRASKGFFVRTLAAELGEALGCGACLKSLRRTASGPFQLSQAVPLARLEELARSEQGRMELAARLVPISAALADLPALHVSASQAAKVVHGVPLEGFADQHGRGKLRVLAPDGALLAIGEIDEARRLKYARVLVQGPPGAGTPR